MGKHLEREGFENRNLQLTHHPLKRAVSWLGHLDDRFDVWFWNQSNWRFINRILGGAIFIAGLLYLSGRLGEKPLSPLPSNIMTPTPTPLSDAIRDLNGPFLVVTAVCAQPHEYAGIMFGPHIDVTISSNNIDTRPDGIWGEMRDEERGRRSLFMYSGPDNLNSNATFHGFFNPIRGADISPFEFGEGKKYIVEYRRAQYTQAYPILSKLVAIQQFTTPVCAK